MQRPRQLRLRRGTSQRNKDGSGSLGGRTEQGQIFQGDAGGDVGAELAVSAVLHGAGRADGHGIAGRNARGVRRQVDGVGRRYRLPSGEGVRIGFNLTGMSPILAAGRWKTQDVFVLRSQRYEG